MPGSTAICLGISLGAHPACTALSIDPDHGGEQLDYSVSLAEVALAEMRALIFELRPESLETEGLVSALTKQVEAMQARHKIVVSTELRDEPDLPVRAQQELYRIAQEAMHNTVKHAHAAKVVLRLERIVGYERLVSQTPGAAYNAGAGLQPGWNFPDRKYSKYRDSYLRKSPNVACTRESFSLTASTDPEYRPLL